MASKDLRHITDGWPYVPGQLSVRRVRGADNHIKIQMRVDLGVLQMEVTGRPDGTKPFGHESLLEYHRRRVEAYRQRNGTDLGFTLSEEECRAIREEALQYYQRYLANFVLEDYEAVSRDTRRNLDVLDLCRSFGSEEDDRFALEVYRPYIIMMHSQSLSLTAIRKGAYRTAHAHVQAGLRTIRDFYREFGQPKAFRASSEVKVLKTLRREIRKHLPTDPLLAVRRELKQAISEERYEDAARLRDQLDTLLKERRQQKTE